MAIAAKPRSAPPTMSDVAHAAGVSTATVSRVLNAPEVVAAPTRHRVLDAIEMLDYRPNAAARTLAGASTETIGLVLPELSGPFFSELLAGVEEAARGAGYHLLVAATEPHGTGAPALSPIDALYVDGAIVLPDAVVGGLVDRIARRRRPVVLVERSDPHLPTVSFDGGAGASAAVRHLIERHGARRIACLAGPNGAEASELREAAWARELAAAGLPVDPALLVRGAWTEHDGMRLAAELVGSGQDFDAVFAVNDETAIGAIRGLERAGRRVPADVRVVGFDDIQLAAWVRPALTTVAASPRVLGRIATEVLIARIGGRQTPLETRIPTSLVVRASCGCTQEEEPAP